MLPSKTMDELGIAPRLPNRSYLNFGESDILVSLIESVRPKNVIEFGVNAGLTAHMILQHVPGIERYQGIDVLPGYRTLIPAQQVEVPINPGSLVKDDDRFELILRAHGSFDLTPEELCSCDAVFIDGDHAYEAVTNDSLLAYRCIQPGGIILWHDYNNPTVEVTAALDDLARCDHAIQYVKHTWVAFERC